MVTNPNKKNRRTIRLDGYDYSQSGTYFIAIITKNRVCLFGKMVDGAMITNNLGIIVREEWDRTPIVRPGITLDAFVIMPNHIHGLLTIKKGGDAITVGASRRLAPTKYIPHGALPGSLGAIIGQFKSVTTKRINHILQSPGSNVWQRNFYEHIIRDDMDFQNTVNYIETNPENWLRDEYSIT